MNDNAAFYEAFARRYVEYYGHVDPVAAVAQWKVLLNKRGFNWLPCNDPRLLDVGCGPGWHLRVWEKEGFRVSGLDLSPSMLRIAAMNAKAGAGTEIPLYCADIRDAQSLLQLKGAFDQAVCHFNFLNLFSPVDLQEVLTGIRSVLTPTGRCMADITLPTTASNARMALGPGIEVSDDGTEVTQHWALSGLDYTERYWLHDAGLIGRLCAQSNMRVAAVIPWTLSKEVNPSNAWPFQRALVVLETTEAKA